MICLLVASSLFVQRPSADYRRLVRAAGKSVSAVRQVIRSGVSPNEPWGDGMNVVWQLAMQPDRREKYDVIKYLVSRGASLKPNKDGLTLLMAASEYRSYWTIRALLECGVPVNAVHPRITALFGVLKGMSQDQFSPLPDPVPALKLLLKYKADPNVEVNHLRRGGTLPLCYVAYAGRLDICKMLVAAGAKVNTTQGVGGYTPLHVACLANRKSNASIVKYFILKGAKLDVKDSEGRTPLELAQQKKFNLIVEAIHSATQSKSRTR